MNSDEINSLIQFSVLSVLCSSRCTSLLSAVVVLFVVHQRHSHIAITTPRALSLIKRKCHNVFNKHQEMFESHISAGATEKLPEWEKSHAKTVVWSYDVEGHAQKCVGRYCELANKDGAAVQSFKSLLG